MKRVGIFVWGLAVLGACQEEVIVHESSIASQFSQMNREGWQVTRNDQPANARSAGSVDPNVRVIRGADFSGYRFSTNFRVDDPRVPQTRPQPLPGASSDVPPANPYAAPPRLPGD
jgi:hypothetical protein